MANPFYQKNITTYKAMVTFQELAFTQDAVGGNIQTVGRTVAMLGNFYDIPDTVEYDGGFRNYKSEYSFEVPYTPFTLEVINEPTNWSVFFEGAQYRISSSRRIGRSKMQFTLYTDQALENV